MGIELKGVHNREKRLCTWREARVNWPWSEMTLSVLYIRPKHDFTIYHSPKVDTEQDPG